MSDRIVFIDGDEYDNVTGSKVFRDKNNRPYVEIEQHSIIQEYDFAQLCVMFYLRIIQDASGDNLYDRGTTKQDQEEAREYLLNGSLERYGYYQYTHFSVNKKRVYEDINYKFNEDTCKHKSPITLQQICNFINEDYDVLAENIRKWQNSGWLRDHPVYQNAMKIQKWSN